MLRSMYSGISGMKGFQNKLDVIGNNIANVNTFGFKKGRVTFKDMVSQQVSGASAPGDTRGGTNPKQVGLGSQLGAIDTIHTQGSLQTTTRTLDLSISGDGFFQVKDGDNTLYTRAGNLYLDKDGDLVNSDGLRIEPSINIPSTAKSISIGSNGTVNYVDEDGELTEAGIIEIAKFPNPDGLEKVGNNLFEETTNSGIASSENPGENGAGTIVSGTLEMSNVDLSEEFTEMIVAQRGFQANTRIITTSDEILQELVNLKR
ncbi:flagellar basal body rod protein FlgG [Bacillus aerolatus]|uniref:Flagellar hook protein FlgE n=1 Tax=Bacillus aerolatus TaxID=2653354 RepID=A0A6I1FI15_9BACI|nr:flagellar basal body rod protein FlgG [Bacillus aerolatus]KAB7708057.1 flagellar basal body rod protein FlgG [Bacillus aerolatus]